MQMFSFDFLNKWYTNKIKNLCNLCVGFFFSGICTATVVVVS